MRTRHITEDGVLSLDEITSESPISVATAIRGEIIAFLNKPKNKNKHLVIDFGNKVRLSQEFSDTLFAELIANHRSKWTINQSRIGFKNLNDWDKARMLSSFDKGAIRLFKK